MTQYQVLVARPDHLVDTLVITADTVDFSRSDDMVVFTSGGRGVLWVKKVNLIYARPLDLVPGRSPMRRLYEQGHTQRLDKEADALRERMLQQREGAKRFAEGGIVRQAPAVGELGPNCA